LIAAGIAGDVLVIGADTFSTIVDPTDRSTSVIFGDGAGAVVLRAGSAAEPGALGPFDLGSDGELSDLIAMPPGGFFAMQGKTVFRHAVERMAASVEVVLGAAGWTAADIDQFVGHQANRRILVALAERLGVPLDRVVSNIDRVGNTAAASIPLALADAATGGGLIAGQRVLLTSFGGGLAWGSTVLTWPALQPA
jgi:3-oxoacyl-[acyl-carrier-protein] synthase-3